jgi:hypothetical protein
MSAHFSRHMHALHHSGSSEGCRTHRCNAKEALSVCAEAAPQQKVGQPGNLLCSGGSLPDEYTSMHHCTNTTCKKAINLAFTLYSRCKAGIRGRISR